MDCPVCGETVDRPGDCPHFVGWTENGQDLLDEKSIVIGSCNRGEHYFQGTGFSCRVFTKEG